MSKKREASMTRGRIARTATPLGEGAGNAHKEKQLNKYKLCEGF